MEGGDRMANSTHELGVVEDTSQLNSFGAIRDWVSYLKHLENTRREE